MDQIHNIVVIAFFTIWLMLLFGGLAFFYGSRDASLKRRWYPRFGTIAMAIFCAFAAYEIGPKVSTLIIPWCAFTYYVNTYTTEFCDSCGATMANTYWTTKTRYCPKCGANLTEAKQNRERQESRRDDGV